MKTHPNRLLFAFAAAATLFAPVCASLHAASGTTVNVEFNINGSLDTVETHVVNPPFMAVQLEGTGNASILGSFVVETNASVFLPTFFGQGTFVIETNSGAELHGTLTGQGSPSPDSNDVPVSETYTITGGTGRFCGATGTLSVQRVLDRVSLVSSGTIAGTVVLPVLPK